MKLSIITCTYNSEIYLQETIDSIIAQNLNSTIYEHIFIDGNSNDKTLEIIKNYQISQGDLYNIVVIQKQPKGIYNAMNEGIKMANGEYLLFLHSDDYLKKNTLKKYLDFIEKTGNLDLYYGKLNTVNIQGKYISTIPHRNIYQKGLNKFILGFMCYITQPSVIHKRVLHDKYGYFDENYKIVSDWEFWITLAKNKVSNLFYNETISNFRIHDDGASTSPQNKALAQREINTVREQYFGLERYLMQFANFLYSKFLN